MTDFHTAATALLLQSPFFGTLLMKVRHEETKKISTLAVSTGRMYFNADFIGRLTDDEGVFCVAHEMMHLAWMHLPRMKHYADSGIGPDGKAYDHDRMNRAADYAANDALRASKVGAIPREEIIKICLDPQRFPHTMTPEEIYCELAKDDEANGGKPSGPGAMDGHEVGQPGGIGDGEEDGDGAGGREGDVPVTASDIIQAANVAKATMGELPAGIDRLLGELTRPKTSPWSRLRKGVVTALSGYDATTWRRLNRRLIVRGIGVPGRTMTGAGRIGIVGDTSGSITEKILQLFGGHMGAIITDARPKEVKLYWTDAEVHRVDTLRTHAQLVTLMRKPVPGGGGTDMRKGIAAALADKCDCIVVLTDGYTPFCDAPVPVFWAITTSVVAPHGTTIHISEE